MPAWGELAPPIVVQDKPRNAAMAVPVAPIPTPVRALVNSGDAGPEEETVPADIELAQPVEPPAGSEPASEEVNPIEVEDSYHDDPSALTQDDYMVPYH